MPTTNGHGPKRAILYARVSTDEQARSGYSLAQQIEALRQYAAREGYEVLEEVQDPGQSGASLERPGMDRVRDLVATGGVSVVLAQDRDRFAREPAYHYLLRREFEEHGTKIRALNDRGDDTPEGELTDGILDQLAKYERAKIAERTRRGMLRKAREGRVVVARPAYGFRYNEAKNALVVCEPEMAVEKVLRLAADGLGQNAIQTRLFREGVPSPTGKPQWDWRMIKRIVYNDAYRPHTFEEISTLLAPEVAATLDPDREYGVQWYNRQRVTERTVSEPDGSGERRYRKTRTFKWRPREEWIAAPVPAHIPRSLVDLARSAMDGRSGRERKNQSRQWELRSLMRCQCGRKMQTRTTQLKSGNRYHYYHCPRSGKRAYPCKQKSLRAEKVEATIWDFVCGMLKRPERIRASMDQLISHERDGRRSDPEREAAAWAEKAAECVRLRGAYQDQQAAGLMTLAELGSKLEELESTRRMVEDEIAALAAQAERVEELERDRDTLLEFYAGAVPGALDRLDGGERNRVYRMLKLEITPREDDILDVRGILSESLRTPQENGSATDDFVLTERHLPIRRSIVRIASRTYEIGAM
jgi:site-specific DNA recombinase